MNEELVKEARSLAAAYVKVGHRHGIESLLTRLADALEDRAEPRFIECPHWAPGLVIMRKGCTACEATK